MKLDVSLTLYTRINPNRSYKYKYQRKKMVEFLYNLKVVKTLNSLREKIDQCNYVIF